MLHKIYVKRHHENWYDEIVEEEAKKQAKTIGIKVHNQLR